MYKKELIAKFQELKLEEQITLEDIPEIDLYMDQVIQLFESNLGSAKRTEEDKVLTKTMINNYSKAKLLMSVNNKKYSKEHLILMSIIYNLKGSLSINDIKSSVSKIVESNESEEKYKLRDVYECYLAQYKDDLVDVEISLSEKADAIEEKINEKDGTTTDFDRNFLLLCSMVNMSNMYRRISEKLVDDYFSKLVEKHK
ncbi:DUF1836 domain-containing protein [Clostridium gasigenes]|uniref:DUF1836 domain-containing protein n=1 Tax=Clostridium gasigenes TaxID=94869 RepID=A0A7X0VT90_9CLOT|nr:DUF1836 domain-containing protein [Clostridium gasigenes]MBB6716550.1 DUF1836 domain-containing protein [Clostridium gasigenes]MBU3134339.1 DUF1836 domain-containing protein [Clostridium gasigenes]